MRRFFLITLGVLFGASALLALYVVWHPDPDDISPEVDAVSFRQQFDATVLKRAGKTWAELPDAGKLKTLGDLIGSANETDPVREVALYEIRNMADKDAAFEIVHRNLANLKPDLYEVGVTSVNMLNTPKSTAYLNKLYATLLADPYAQTPMAGYRTGSLVARTDPASGELRLAFNEQSRTGADYTIAKARQIALLLPGNPTHVLAFPNFDDVLDRFNDSRFVKSLKGSPVGQDAWTLPLLRSIAALRERLTEDVGFMAPYFAPERLFRDHLLIGNYNGQFLLVSYKDKNASVAETLMKIFESLGKDYGVKRWQSAGFAVSGVFNKKNNRSLSYATVGDYFVISTDTALMTRSLQTYTTGKGSSVAIDPGFNKAYGALDMTGQVDVGFAWINPTEYFAVQGSQMPAARRLAIVARTLGKPLNETAATAADLHSVPGIIATAELGGQSMGSFWTYITGVRTVGKKTQDSLRKITGVDVGKQIIPYLGFPVTLGYAGTQYLRSGNGYSNTGFHVLLAVPLKNAPANFDQTLLTFFKRSAKLAYKREEGQSGGKVWIASDTTLERNDTALATHGFQPSFAITNDGLLLVAATPWLLRRAMAAHTMAAGPEFMRGTVHLDSLAFNAEQYLRPYLKSTDRYTPEEINTRLEPMRKALCLYDRFEWSVTVGADGLRKGEGRLIARP